MIIKSLRALRESVKRVSRRYENPIGNEVSLSPSDRTVRDLKSSTTGAYRANAYFSFLTRTVIQLQISRTIGDKLRELLPACYRLRAFYCQRREGTSLSCKTRDVRLPSIRMLLIVPVRFDSSRLPTGSIESSTLETRVSACTHYHTCRGTASSNYFVHSTRGRCWARRLARR